MARWFERFFEFVKPNSDDYIRGADFKLPEAVVDCATLGEHTFLLGESGTVYRTSGSMPSKMTKPRKVT